MDEPMGGNERVRRYRARQRGQIVGNEPLRPGPKVDRAANILRLIHRLGVEASLASPEEAARLVESGWIVSIKEEDGSVDWYVDIYLPGLDRDDS
jgi:hypothetical protein